MSDFSSICLYLIVYTASALFMKNSKIIERKKMDASFVVAILLPVLLAAFRNNVGTDFMNYTYMYRRMTHYRFITWLNRDLHIDGTPFGMWVFSRIAGRLGSSCIFFGLVALTIYLPVAYTLKKHYSPELTFYFVLTFLLGQFTNGLNGMKQYAAMSIIFFGLVFVYERDFKKFLLTLLAASCFHPSSFVALPIYFLWKPYDSGISFKRIAIFVFCVLFLNFMPEFLGLLGGRFEQYTIYTDEVSNKSFYLNLAWLIIFLLFRKQYVEMDYRNDLLIVMLMIGQVLGLSGFFSPAVNRIALYYSFPRFLLIGQLPIVFHKNDSFIIKVAVFIYVITMFIVNYQIYGFSDIIPYNFVGGGQ